MRASGLFLACLCLFLAVQPLRAEEEIEVGRPVDPSLILGPEVRFKVDLAGAKDNVKMVQLKDGSVGYIVKRLGAGTDLLLTPEEFSRLYYDQQTANRGWLFTLMNVTSVVGLAWVALGFGGQAVFGGRMLVQWLASEKLGRSVVPLSFWWMSVIGSTMLIVYFIWRRDIVGVIGQCTGWPIYLRNIFFIYRARSAASAASAA